MHELIVTDEFLLFSELCALWAIFSYAIAADPLPEDTQSHMFPWRTWRIVLVARLAGTALLSYVLSHSLVVSAWLATTAVIHPWIRLRSPLKWTAEFEALAVLFNLFFTLAFVRQFHLVPQINIPAAVNNSHVSAVCIVAAILLFTLRGGTYIVRGCLRKADTLPHLPDEKRAPSVPRTASEKDKSPQPPSPPPASAHDSSSAFLDVIEINRGRLIGNLERILLTIVVAAGSYAALAFLVAAKGLIRSEELQERDFAEYFLVGSLASVLVALCAGIVMRYALISLWPQLLSLQIQGS